MAYFLKKSTLKRRSYLPIVESFYSHDKHGAAHRTYKSLAYVETWKAKVLNHNLHTTKKLKNCKIK